jgi:hypothetical protein
MLVARDDTPRHGEDQRHADIGDVVRQHVGRVGDGDAAGLRRRQVDMIEADALGGDDLGLGQRRNELGIDPARAGRNRAHPVLDLAEEGRAMFRRPQAVHREILVELLHRRGIDRHYQHDIGFHPESSGLRGGENASRRGRRQTPSHLRKGAGCR